MLNLSHERKGEVDIITLAGILNADTSPQLEASLETFSEETQPKILLNLPGLTYISSAGVGCFIGVIKRIRTKGGDIRFACMDPKVKRVFNLLDMGDFFHFYSTLEEGIESFDS